MPTKMLVTPMDGTPKQIVFGDHAGDFNPAAANDLRVTTDGSQESDVQLSLAGLADGAARQSAKVDLGPNWAPSYLVRCAFEFDAATPPTAGEVVELYWAPSQSGTAGNANPGGVSGTDSAYSGYSSNLADSIKQLVHIGDFVCTADGSTTVQVGVVGEFAPPSRYGSLVVKNESGAAFFADDVESHVVFDPIVPELQN